MILISFIGQFIEGERFTIGPINLRNGTLSQLLHL